MDRRISGVVESDRDHKCIEIIWKCNDFFKINLSFFLLRAIPTKSFKFSVHFQPNLIIHFKLFLQNIAMTNGNFPRFIWVYVHWSVTPNTKTELSGSMNSSSLSLAHINTLKRAHGLYSTVYEICFANYIV